MRFPDDGMGDFSDGPDDLLEEAIEDLTMNSQGTLQLALEQLAAELVRRGSDGTLQVVLGHLGDELVRRGYLVSIGVGMPPRKEAS